MFGKFHIHRYGSALCHESGGSYINFEAAAGMNTDNCCEDCRRRYLNLAKMLKLESNMITIDKASLRAKTEEYLTPLLASTRYAAQPAPLPEQRSVSKGKAT